MVTKAEIQSIDFAGNTCVVRMPYFESAAGGDKAIATAIFSNTPGTFNGYKVGDIVLVAFEDGQAQQPCVIGKLYLGVAEENKEARGTINAEALTSSSTNSIPLSTKLTSDTLDDTAKSNDSANSFKTIKELAEAVQNLAISSDKNDTVKITNTTFTPYTTALQQAYLTPAADLTNNKVYHWKNTTIIPETNSNYSQQIKISNMWPGTSYSTLSNKVYIQRELSEDLANEVFIIGNIGQTITSSNYFCLANKIELNKSGWVQSNNILANFIGEFDFEVVDSIDSNFFNIYKQYIYEKTITTVPLANTANSFSAQEQAIGTWIDGKTIYRKVFKSTANLTKNTEQFIGTIGTNLSDVLSIKHTTTYTPPGKNNSAYEFYYDPADGHHTVVGCRVDKITGDVYICSCNDSWSDTVLIVIVEYTKAE